MDRYLIIDHQNTLFCNNKGIPKKILDFSVCMCVCIHVCHRLHSAGVKVYMKGGDRTTRTCR